MTDLLGALKTVVSEETVKEKGWPKAANALSGRLRRATPDLRKAGISVRIEDVGHAKVRTIFLSCRIDKPRKPSTASTAAPSDNDFNGLDFGSPRWTRTPNLRLNRGADIQTTALFEPRQILHQPPVFQPVLLGQQQCRRGLALFVEPAAKRPSLRAK